VVEIEEEVVTVEEEEEEAEEEEEEGARVVAICWTVEIDGVFQSVDDFDDVVVFTVVLDVVVVVRRLVVVEAGFVVVELTFLTQVEPLTT